MIKSTRLSEGEKPRNLLEEILAEFNKEDNRSWCSKCGKEIKCGAYCWEDHYNKFHPEIAWASARADPLGKTKEWGHLTYIEAVLKRIQRRKHIKVRSKLWAHPKYRR